jgi:hypothetical protein
LIGILLPFITNFRARVLDTVKRDRDGVFEQHNVYDDIKTRVTALAAEANGTTEGVNESK